MNVTKKSIDRIYKALLKHFNAKDFVILNSWCDIGIADSDELKSLMFSPHHFDTVTSTQLFNHFCKFNIGVARSIFLSDINITNVMRSSDLAYSFPFDEVKMMVVRDIIKAMKHNGIFTKDRYGRTTMPALSYEQFAIEYDLMR